MKRLATALLLTALLAGCQTANKHANLTADDHIVGGGYAIEFTAPFAGTAILVDNSTGKYVATKSMEAGDDFEMSLDPSEEHVQQLLGEDLSSTNLILYFVPNEWDDESAYKSAE